MYVDILVPYAVAASDKDLAAATDLLISLALTDAQVVAQRAFASRGVYESCISGDELRRFITTDQEGADLRTATQRRHDALLAVLRRGVSAPGEAPTTSKAKVFLTMPLAALMAMAAAFPTAPTIPTTPYGPLTPHDPFKDHKGQRASEPQLNHLGGPGVIARPGMGRTFTREALTSGAGASDAL